ncbi:DNA polymerase-3 subunit epsilon [Colwellia chukchiensis]|uniref:DNA polymerase-3 subunit epsilon n=1 Tax=Colwellia chukchiensis TaxID=641665 RepID=A0A1H7SZN1_9GAMM|nr:exonuclease domain-containing protein [Colwellia chukchiensis]SEL78112.1 DNA polymerase-3 subunit epsilon [Colwellia chukchiensis]
MLEHHFLFRSFIGYEAQRKRMLKSAPAGPLRTFLSQPFPALDTPFEDIEILAVDFETTGLDAVKDKLLSVGCVDVTQQQIKLASSYHAIIHTQGSLQADNVTIHQITDDQKDQGQPLADVIAQLLERLAGKVMLVHFARIERQFLRQACLELYGMAPPLPIIDTLVVAKKMLDKSAVAYDPSQLRLAALRAKYHLPDHYAHNALNDAIATAELLLAINAERQQALSLQQLIL